MDPALCVGTCCIVCSIGICLLGVFGTHRHKGLCGKSDDEETHFASIPPVWSSHHNATNVASSSSSDTRSNGASWRELPIHPQRLVYGPNRTRGIGVPRLRITQAPGTGTLRMQGRNRYRTL